MAIAPSTTEDFVRLAQQAGVLDADTFQKMFPRRVDLPEDANRCANMLISKGLMTTFQAKNLLAGKVRGFLLGSYRILQPIGKGGMGVVYLGEHTTLKRRVALKILPEEHSTVGANLERFYREARAVAALDHPNIVRLYDINQGGGMHFLAMEFVDGSDLQSLMAKTGVMHHAQAVSYIAQAAEGLQHAHQRGFIHRDIKPSNLMLTKEGVLKILDLGLARSFEDEKDQITKLQESGTVIGTMDFISPEQAFNEKVDERSDIYSLGATLYVLVSGHPPFQGTSTQKMMQHRMSEPPRLNKLRAKIPPGLVDVIGKMMAKNPNDRYQNCEDVIDALSPWLPAPKSNSVVGNMPDSVEINLTGGVTTSHSRVVNAPTQNVTSTISLPADLAKSASRMAWIIGGCIAFGLFAVGVLFYLMKSSDHPNQNNNTNPPDFANRNTNTDPAHDSKSTPNTQPTPAFERFKSIPFHEVTTVSSSNPLYANDNADKLFMPNWGKHTVEGIPFQLISPDEGHVKNVLILHSECSELAKLYPKKVAFPIQSTASKIHLLGCISGWGFPCFNPDYNMGSPKGSDSMTVRIHYRDKLIEDHILKNGIHLADYIDKIEVPESKFAILTANKRQIRYLAISVKRPNESIEKIEFIKNDEDHTSPTFLAMTIDRLPPSGSSSDSSADSAVVKPTNPVLGSSQQSIDSPVLDKLFPISIERVANANSDKAPFGEGNDNLTLSDWQKFTFQEVPFDLIDPTKDENNLLVLHSKTQKEPVRIPCFLAAKRIYFLGGVAKNGFPANNVKQAVVKLKLHYADGSIEEHEMFNGVQIADYSKKVDVEGSKFAVGTKSSGQVRFLSIAPKKATLIQEIELMATSDEVAPIFLGLTIETP